MKLKIGLILAAAIIVPGGFVALGVWKAYELYKEKEEDDENDNNGSDNPIGSYSEFNDYRKLLLSKHTNNNK